MTRCSAASGTSTSSRSTRSRFPTCARPMTEGGSAEERRSEQARPADGEPGSEAAGVAPDGNESDEGAEDDGLEGAAERAWTMRERLRHKPFERMSPQELHDAERLVDELRPRLETRRTRRHELHRHGRVIATRAGLPPQHPERGRPRRVALAPTRRTAALDAGDLRHQRIDGPPLAPADALHDRAAPGESRPDRSLRLRHPADQGHARARASRDPDVALEKVSGVVNDWSGGTRIGESLRQFNQRWARRVLRSSGVVIIVSDGWDRGDPGLVSAEMARLQRSCHRLIWLNPLAGTDSYQPLAAGMAAAYPYIDDLVAVSDLDSLEGLAGLLAQMAEDRSRRPDRTGVPVVHRPRAAGRSLHPLRAAR